jgi:hypothetical protein
MPCNFQPLTYGFVGWKSHDIAQGRPLQNAASRGKRAAGLAGWTSQYPRARTLLGLGR